MDTISFRIIGSENFRILDWANWNMDFKPRKFSDLSEKERANLQSKKRPYVRKFVLQNGVQTDLYFPQVELFEKATPELRKVYYEIKVVVSLPKLIFDNSIQEIIASDRIKIIDALQNRLERMGIYTHPLALEASPLSVVHFCKNVILPVHIKFAKVISHLSSFDMGQAYDTTKEKFFKAKDMNSEVLHLYCGSREWVFYEKTTETKEGIKDKGNNGNLYSFLNKEIFRFEYRLNKTQTIRSEINKLLSKPHEAPFLVRDIFSDELWKAVLTQAWRKMCTRSGNQLTLWASVDNDKFDLLEHVCTKAYSKNKKMYSLNSAFTSYGLAHAMKKCGVKAVRNKIKKVWCEKTAGTRLNEKIEAAIELMKEAPLPEGISFIEKELKEFRFIKLT